MPSSVRYRRNKGSGSRSSSSSRQRSHSAPHRPVTYPAYRCPYGRPERSKTGLEVAGSYLPNEVCSRLLRQCGGDCEVEYRDKCNNSPAGDGPDMHLVGRMKRDSRKPRGWVPVRQTTRPQDRHGRAKSWNLSDQYIECRSVRAQRSQRNKSPGVSWWYGNDDDKGSGSDKEVCPVDAAAVAERPDNREPWKNAFKTIPLGDKYWDQRRDRPRGFYDNEVCPETNVDDGQGLCSKSVGGRSDNNNTRPYQDHGRGRQSTRDPRNPSHCSDRKDIYEHLEECPRTASAGWILCGSRDKEDGISRDGWPRRLPKDMYSDDDVSSEVDPKGSRRFDEFNKSKYDRETDPMSSQGRELWYKPGRRNAATNFHKDQHTRSECEKREKRDEFISPIHNAGSTFDYRKCSPIKSVREDQPESTAYNSTKKRNKSFDHDFTHQDTRSERNEAEKAKQRPEGGEYLASLKARYCNDPEGEEQSENISDNNTRYEEIVHTVRENELDMESFKARMRQKYGIDNEKSRISDNGNNASNRNSLLYDCIVNDDDFSLDDYEKKHGKRLAQLRAKYCVDEMQTNVRNSQDDVKPTSGVGSRQGPVRFEDETERKNYRHRLRERTMEPSHCHQPSSHQMDMSANASPPYPTTPNTFHSKTSPRRPIDPAKYSAAFERSRYRINQIKHGKSPSTEPDPNNYFPCLPYRLDILPDGKMVDSHLGEQKSRSTSFSHSRDRHRVASSRNDSSRQRSMSPPTRQRRGCHEEKENAIPAVHKSRFRDRTKNNESEKSDRRYHDKIEEEEENTIPATVHKSRFRDRTKNNDSGKSSDRRGGYYYHDGNQSANSRNGLDCDDGATSHRPEEAPHTSPTPSPTRPNNRHHHHHHRRPYSPALRVMSEPPPTCEEEWMEKHVDLMSDCQIERVRTSKERMKRIVHRANLLRGSSQRLHQDLNDIETRMDRQVSTLQKRFLDRTEEAVNLVRDGSSHILTTNHRSSSHEKPSILKNVVKAYYSPHNRRRADEEEEDMLNDPQCRFCIAENRSRPTTNRRETSIEDDEPVDYLTIDVSPEVTVGISRRPPAANDQGDSSYFPRRLCNDRTFYKTHDDDTLPNDRRENSCSNRRSRSRSCSPARHYI